VYRGNTKLSVLMIKETRIGERGCQQLTEIEHFVTPITTIGNGTADN
jgi:hypothetical protein